MEGNQLDSSGSKRLDLFEGRRKIPKVHTEKRRNLVVVSLVSP